MKRAKRGVILLVVVAMMISVFAGCSNSAGTDASPSAPTESATQTSENTAEPSESPAEDSTGTHTVVDFYDREVEIPNEVDSIICITPAVTQILAMLGAEDAVVAGAGTFTADTLNGKMFPGLNDLAAMSRDDVNVESVLEYDPDVIIWGYGIDSVPEAIIEAEIPVVACNILSAEELMDAVDLMGEVLGGEAAEEAAAYREYYTSRISEAEERTADIPEEDRPTVYIANGSTLRTNGKDSMPYSWVTLCGGKLASLDLELGDTSNIDVTLEELINLDPDIIVATSTEVRDEFLSEPQYAGLSAVKNNQVYANPKGGSVWYLGHVEAPIQLTYAFTIIHPELAEEVDVEKEVRYFYETFYEYDLTDEEYQEIMNP